jgi:hypothetical protein
MSTKSKIVAAATIAMLGLASPAFAQVFSIDAGTGNILPSYYSGSGALHFGAGPRQNQIAARSSGLNAFADISIRAEKKPKDWR